MGHPVFDPEVGSNPVSPGFLVSSPICLSFSFYLLAFANQNLRQQSIFLIWNFSFCSVTSLCWAILLCRLTHFQFTLVNVREGEENLRLKSESTKESLRAPRNRNQRDCEIWNDITLKNLQSWLAWKCWIEWNIAIIMEWDSGKCWDNWGLWSGGKCVTSLLKICRTVGISFDRKSFRTANPYLDGSFFCHFRFLRLVTRGNNRPWAAIREIWFRRWQAQSRWNQNGNMSLNSGTSERVGWG
jgi:hypothetical protein